MATAELKNQLTNQSVEEAISQYRNDRDPNATSLARRAVVHFAVNTERVSMTSRLAGGATRFLPFNRGDSGGAGNQANPDGHRTAYLWEQVWQRDAWLDLLGRFVHVQLPPKGSKAAPSVIFPRWHQWDAVLTLEHHARVNGAGQRYLVQHSAGSGKSNTIAWLTHRLSSLHDATDTKVFDKVIVITDRVVLGSQLQDTIYQFEHAHGVVAKIDDDSTQLAEALSGHTSRIIVTTLHVAFSGTVSDDGIDVTESKLNGFPDTQTAKRFDEEGHILVVAEKYQTGFDQPLLYAMYVDKVLTGLSAVQTLSRLNRIADDKDGTFVLDFRNDAEAIREAFEPWYGKTIAPSTDPNLLYDTRSTLDPFGVLMIDEVAKVAGLLVTMASVKDHGRIHAALQPAIDRFHALDGDNQDGFRDALDRFVRTYSFLAQLVSFGDTKLERDYLYCRALGAFVRRDPGSSLDLGSEVELTHLRHEMTYQGSVSLTSDMGEVRTISDGMGRRQEPAEEALSQIITKLNERYGLKLTEADRRTSRASLPRLFPTRCCSSRQRRTTSTTSG